MYDDRALVGVGGWLAFFVIILAVLTPVRLGFSLYSDIYSDPAVGAAYGDAWPVLQAFAWLTTAATIGGCWYLVWRLMKVEVWQTVRIVIAGIWIISVGMTVAQIAGISLIAGIPIVNLAAEMPLEMVRPVIFCMIWTAYFLRSERVANTYARDPDESDMAEVFG